MPSSTAVNTLRLTALAALSLQLAACGETGSEAGEDEGTGSETSSGSGSGAGESDSTGAEGGSCEEPGSGPAPDADACGNVYPVVYNFEGSRLPQSCDTGAVFEGTIVAGEGTLAVDACPCDADCADEDIQVFNLQTAVPLLTGLQPGTCVHVEASAPGCDRRWLSVTEPGVESCGVILDYFAEDGATQELPLHFVEDAPVSLTNLCLPTLCEGDEPLYLGSYDLTMDGVTHVWGETAAAGIVCDAEADTVRTYGVMPIARATGEAGAWEYQFEQTLWRM